jgi:hypothetical protein
MNDASVSAAPAATSERWPEMVSLVGSLVIRGVAIGIGAATLLILTASVFV